MKNQTHLLQSARNPGEAAHQPDPSLTATTTTCFWPGIVLVLLAGLALLPGRAAGAVFDDFESYAVGSNLHGQGGWAGWEGDGNAGAQVSGAFSFSPTRSVNITGPSDLVRTFSGATNGQWVFSVMQYIPSTSSGTNYVVLLNTYRPPYGDADLKWSVQIQCDLTAGHVISDLGGGATLPMIKDRWVEVRCEINLASNSVSEFYNGRLLSTHAWQVASGTPGLNEIQALDLFANNAGPVYYDTVNLTDQSLVITVDIGRPSQSCSGFGICSITIGPLASTRAVPAAATWVNGRLQLSFLAEPPDKTNVLTIDQDIVLTSATARALGYEHVTVRAGQYPVDYSRNPYGEVSPDVTARGIIITIETGRRSKGCTGFGICSITIDVSLSTRAVPAAATWGNGRLLLNYLAEPPDKTNVLTIDQDLMLDSATSRALGYEHVTVRAGQYPVDYSVNPHGEVSPDVTARGIIIRVVVGLPSGGCHPGFGICSITIGFPASASAVPTAATWDNGRLQLSFLAEPPDKTNLFTIEQDIVLDSATARALGYEHVTLRAGQYPVDYSVNPHGQVSPDVTARGIVITIHIGRHPFCTGFGFCGITIETAASPRAIQAGATWSNGRLQLNFLAEPPDKTNVLTIDEDIVLDSATSRALGYEHVTLRAGQYPVDFSVNPHGQVSPDVTTQGIIITIDCTRRCISGFGFCSITIDPSASTRAVPTAANWVNGRLQLSFLTEPPDKTNVLVLDEDLVLDSATSRALGYEHVTLRAGQYPVDYSVNPHGQVSPDVSARGIVITIYIGRHGCSSGFGICGISIERSASPRAVPTAASWNNGRLHLNLLAEPADKTSVLTIDDDIVLDNATSRALGYEHVTVRAGQYPVDFSVNPHGQVSPNVTVQGLNIWVKIGLPKAGGCVPGFGICGIGTGNPPFDRAVPAAATIVNGCLKLSFLSDPPDKTNVLTIAQDLMLDGATARLLGYDQITMRAGQYPGDDSDNPHGDYRIVIDIRGIVITIETGRGTNCQGFGICSLTVESFLRPRSVPATAEWVNGRLQLSYLAEPPDKTNVLMIDKDVALDSATSRALGYEHVTLRAGQYPVDFSVNPHGQVSPDVITQGIIIKIDFRRWCERGFGFCSITIGPLASARAVPTAATWVNGRLHLSFLTEPPDKTNVLVLDEDLVLDTATSRALGYEQVTLRAGQYPVDFSVNPHGQVSPDTLARGLGITIQIYRRNAGAPCTKGFGLCGIVIEIPLSARDVPAAAEWVNGRLQLNFLAEPPDKTNVWTVDQDVVLDREISRLLGYEQVTIRAGQYPVDYSRNPFGQVSPDTTAQGLTIWVQIGLRSRGCSGFGLCGIGTGNPPWERGVQAAATWVNGGLHLNFLSEPPDKTNVLVLERDLAFDPASSRLLGHGQVTLRAGHYAMDYSHDPNGEVSPDTTIQEKLSVGYSADGALTITWPGVGWTLQTAESVLGPWVKAESQTSPVNLTPSGPRKYYRLVKP